MAILKHIRAIEQQAAFCVDVLQGSIQQPSPEKWNAAKQHCQELQQQWHCQAIPAAAQLTDKLASSLQIYQVGQQPAQQRTSLFCEQMRLVGASLHVSTTA
jgi:hypothetical protein